MKAAVESTISAICGLMLTVAVSVMLPACSGAASGSTGKAADRDLYSVNGLREILDTERNQGVLLGHQDDLAYGSAWYGQPGRSDVKEVCGDYPAVFGWDISGIERGTGFNNDSVSIQSIRGYISDVAEMGGISTIRWSACVLTDDSARDIAIDSVALFLSSLRNSGGNAISVVFQPVFGDCGNIEPETLRRVWKMLYSAVGEKTKNVLYAYSVCNPQSPADFARAYPGDGYVDIVGFELLTDECEATSFKRDFSKGVELLCDFSKSHKKIPAITATGMRGIKVSDFFTSCIMPSISGRQIGYIMFWKNLWKDEDYYFVPVKGHPAADDFCRFVDSGKVLMCPDLSAKNNS